MTKEGTRILAMHQSVGENQFRLKQKEKDKMVEVCREKKKKEIDRFFNVYECLKQIINKQEKINARQYIENKTPEKTILAMWKQVIRNHVSVVKNIIRGY